MTTLRRILQLSAKEAATSGSTPRQSPNLSENEESVGGSEDGGGEEVNIEATLKRPNSATIGASGGPGRKKAKHNLLIKNEENKKDGNKNNNNKSTDSPPKSIASPRISFDSNIVVITEYKEEEEEEEEEEQQQQKKNKKQEQETENNDYDNNKPSNKEKDSKPSSSSIPLNIPPPPSLVRKESNNSIKASNSNLNNRVVSSALQRATSTGTQKVGKKSTMQTPAPSAIGANNFSVRKVEWVMCELCKQWRKLPPSILTTSLPEVWKCSMNNWDVSRANCAAPQEVDEEQVRFFAFCFVFTYLYMIVTNPSKTGAKCVGDKTARWN